jgi:hypothetical protein
MANEAHNLTPMSTAKDGEFPAELFHGTKVRPNLNHFYPFGCPVFVLNERMQAGQKIPKWELRAIIGLYLGMSTQHAQTVALVLNRKTGLVSPQFQIKFDAKFDSVQGSLGNVIKESKWQEECDFQE